LYLITVRFIALSSLAAAEAARFNAKDVWDRPKDAGTKK
jgi:hypothetical protein